MSENCAERTTSIQAEPNSISSGAKREVRKARYVRPWSQLAIEMEPEHGHWSDYAAWREWFGSQKMLDYCDGYDIITAAEEIDLSDTLLYSAFADAADFYYSQTLAGKLSALWWRIRRWDIFDPRRMLYEWRSVRNGTLYCQYHWWHDLPYPHKHEKFRKQKRSQSASELMRSGEATKMSSEARNAVDSGGQGGPLS